MLLGLAGFVVGCAPDDGGDVGGASTVTTTGSSGVSSTSSLPSTSSVVTTSTVPPTTTPPSTGQVLLDGYAGRLDAALRDEFAASPELHGYLVLLRTDDGGEWSGSAGEATADASFRIASVTKMFTAAAVLRLTEQGRFGLDDAIAQLVDPATADLLSSGGYDPSSITVHQLLTHTAGLVDFTFEPSLDFVGTVIADPQRRWTRREQLELAMQAPPVGPPGAQYHYTDTGYALLGEIVERASGLTLGAAMRELLDFDALGIEHTYQESIDAVPDGQPERIHQWFGELDTYDWDPSLDLYGGGGLVSTAGDLATFVTALIDGKVFDDPATLAAMLAVPQTNAVVSVPGDPRSLAAASGIFLTEVAGQRCVGHDGFWGVQVLHCREIGLTVVASRSQAAPPPTFTGATLGAVVLELVADLAA